MAVLHEQMAACLRSDKSVAECHSQMMTSCQKSMGKSGCPMMGGGMMGHGAMGKDMQGQMHAPPASDQK